MTELTTRDVRKIERRLGLIPGRSHLYLLGLVEDERLAALERAEQAEGVARRNARQRGEARARAEQAEAALATLREGLQREADYHRTNGRNASACRIEALSAGDNQ